MGGLICLWRKKTTWHDCRRWVIEVDEGLAKSRVIPGTPNNGTSLMVSFPYYSHTIPISLGILMGIVWEAYHKGVPLLGVPENPTEKGMGIGPPRWGKNRTKVDDCRRLATLMARAWFRTPDWKSLVERSRFLKKRWSHTKGKSMRKSWLNAFPETTIVPVDGSELLLTSWNLLEIWYNNAQTSTSAFPKKNGFLFHQLKSSWVPIPHEKQLSNVQMPYDIPLYWLVHTDPHNGSILIPM